MEQFGENIGGNKEPQERKLVRDKIPEIMRREGGASETRILEGDEYLDALKKKLMEEIQEFLDSFSVEEAADVLEVMHAILKSKGVDINPGDIEQARLRKREQRGGFDQGISLKK